MTPSEKLLHDYLDRENATTELNYRHSLLDFAKTPAAGITFRRPSTACSRAMPPPMTAPRAGNARWSAVAIKREASLFPYKSLRLITLMLFVRVHGVRIEG